MKGVITILAVENCTRSWESEEEERLVMKGIDGCGDDSLLLNRRASITCHSRCKSEICELRVNITFQIMCQFQ